MSNNGCGQLGAIQTRGTCWFYSILNGFILSEDGQKILYNRLTNFYKKLSLAERAYFDDQFNAPCPMKNLVKTKEIYFWKFIDQYLCFMSGPRAASLKAGKSVSILGGVSLTGTLAREKGGAMGAKPQEEIIKILTHLGFKEGAEGPGKDFMVVDFDKAQKAGKFVFDHRKKPKFIIVKRSGGNYMEIAPPEFLIKDADYSLMCSSILIGNTQAKSSEMHKYHAVAGFVCGGNGYIYDSNQRRVFKCDYWKWPSLKTTLDKNVGAFYNFFKGGKINYYSLAFHILARKEFTKDIGAACLMKYKTKTLNRWLNFTSPNLGARLNDPKLFTHLQPAQRIALKRKWARTEHRAPVYINQGVYNSIVNSAKNFASGNRTLRNLTNAGYRVKDPKNYNEFLQKLRNKFPPAKAYTFAEAKAHLNQFSTKSAAARKLQYSLVWKGIPLAQRKVLMHWRNKGEWLANNAFEEKAKPPIKRKSVAKPKSPSPSPSTKRRTQMRTNFEKYWSALQPNNRKMLRNYIAARKSPSTNANKMNYMNFGTPSPSPVKNTSVLTAAKRNVNALKTAKARKEYKRTRAVNMNQTNWTALGRYINAKDAEAQRARAAKKSVKK
jgi:hypothetical protein